MSNQNFIDIKILIHYHCFFSKSVFILGDLPNLGEWDINKAIKLDWR